MTDVSQRHDLFEFMKQMSGEMASEYSRIQKRTAEDPGTAGDQGEENWATLLRQWLPRNLQVVTKGRILGHDGYASPQVDVLVLDDIYPEKLLDKKHYLAAGVVAAFECKTTLRAAHISKAVENSVKIKSLYPKRYGSPYRELRSPIVYGLLAHSHSWTAEKSQPEKNIENLLLTADGEKVHHPCFQLDLLCVADLASWCSSVQTFHRQRLDADFLGFVQRKFGVDAYAATFYMCHSNLLEQSDGFTPIGALISKLTKKLAWENSSLRNLADYYSAVNIGGASRGWSRSWPISIYHEEIQADIKSGKCSPKHWQEWGYSFE